MYRSQNDSVLSENLKCFKTCLNSANHVLENFATFGCFAIQEVFRHCMHKQQFCMHKSYKSKFGLVQYIYYIKSLHRVKGAKFSIHFTPYLQ